MLSAKCVTEMSGCSGFGADQYKVILSLTETLGIKLVDQEVAFQQWL